MLYLWQHIGDIIRDYNGKEPLTHYLREYFRKFPKLGSRDRRMLSDMTYCWYRAAHGLAMNIADTALLKDAVAVCLKLCGKTETLQKLRLEEKEGIVFDAERLLPADLPLSQGIEKREWLRAMLVQPDLFIRVRKNKNKILELLDEQDIPYHWLTPTCLALPNGVRIDDLLPEDSYVVQDASSQYTGSFFNPLPGERWYDCCSGAGGKSLLLRDLQPGVEQTVTDVRESILRNLEDRFRRYGMRLPVAHVANAADKASLQKALGSTKFDHIICDVPCSGSGTWARTPEQLHFFEPGDLHRYTRLQREIAVNVANYLKQDGSLFYITCSVFRAENEDALAHIEAHSDLRVQQKLLVNGITQKADSMFVAVLA